MFSSYFNVENNNGIIPLIDVAATCGVVDAKIGANIEINDVGPCGPGAIRAAKLRAT